MHPCPEFYAGGCAKQSFEPRAAAERGSTVPSLVHICASPGAMRFDGRDGYSEQEEETLLVFQSRVVASGNPDLDWAWRANPLAVQATHILYIPDTVVVVVYGRQWQASYAAACIRWAPECGRIYVGDFEGAILRRLGRRYGQKRMHYTSVTGSSPALLTNQSSEARGREEERDVAVLLKACTVCGPVDDYSLSDTRGLA